jgi:heat shock protein HslJ
MRRLSKVIWRSTVVLGLVLAGCGGPPVGSGDPVPSTAPPPAGTDPADAADRVEGSWVLTAGAVDGTRLEQVADHRVTLIIEGTEIGGIAACNHYGARAVMGADGLRLDGMGMTMMGCRDDVMALESVYLEALMRVRQLERDGDELVASGDGVELRFSELDAPPTADLVDTTWVLDGLVSDDVVAAPMGEPAWLEIRSDGTFAGSTGCRSFEGQWMERGDQIDAPSWGMDETECPPALQAQDGHVVTVIGDGFIPTLDGGRLTLMDVDGTGLVYRADR